MDRVISTPPTSLLAELQFFPIRTPTGTEFGILAGYGRAPTEAYELGITFRMFAFAIMRLKIGLAADALLYRMASPEPGFYYENKIEPVLRYGLSGQLPISEQVALQGDGMVMILQGNLFIEPMGALRLNF